jgi:hypothetical protein
MTRIGRALALMRLLAAVAELAMPFGELHASLELLAKPLYNLKTKADKIDMWQLVNIKATSMWVFQMFGGSKRRADLIAPSVSWCSVTHEDLYSCGSWLTIPFPGYINIVQVPSPVSSLQVSPSRW